MIFPTFERGANFRHLDPVITRLAAHQQRLRVDLTAIDFLEHFLFAHRSDFDGTEKPAMFHVIPIGAHRDPPTLLGTESDRSLSQRFRAVNHQPIDLGL